MLSKRAKDVHRCLKHIDSFSNEQASVIDWDSDMLRWMKLCLKPNGGPYKGGKFQFEVTFGKHYPKAAPVVSCLTPIYHPNIDSDCEEYNVCLSLLDDWQETFGLEDLIQGLLYLMYHPNLDDPLSPLFEGNLDYEGYVRNVRRSLRGHQIMGVTFQKMIDENKEEDDLIIKEYADKGASNVDCMVNGLVQDVLDKVTIVPLPSFECYNVEKTAEVLVDEGCVGYVPERPADSLDQLPNSCDINNKAEEENGDKEMQRHVEDAGFHEDLSGYIFPKVEDLPSPKPVVSTEDCSVLSGGVVVSSEDYSVLSGGVVASTEDCSVLSGGVVASAENCSVLSGGAVASAENCSVLSGGVVASAENCSVLSGGVVASAENCSVLSGGVVASAENCSVLSGGVVTSTENCSVLSGEVVASSEDCSVLSGGVVARTEDCSVLSGGVVTSTEDCFVLSGGVVTSTEDCSVLSGEVVTSAENCSVLSGGVVTSAEDCSVLSGGVVASIENCSVLSGGVVACTEDCSMLSGGVVTSAENCSVLSGRVVTSTEDCPMLSEGVVSVSSDKEKDSIVQEITGELSRSEDCAVQTESSESVEGACGGGCRVEEFQRLTHLLDELLQRAKMETEEVEAALQQRRTSATPHPTCDDVVRNIVSQHGMQSERAHRLLETIHQAIRDMLPLQLPPHNRDNGARPHRDSYSEPLLPPPIAEPVSSIPIPDILQKVEAMIQNIEEHGEPDDDIPTDSDTYFTEDEDDEDDTFDDDDDDDDEAVFMPRTRPPRSRSAVPEFGSTELEQIQRREHEGAPIWLVSATLGVVLSCVVDLGNMFALF